MKYYIDIPIDYEGVEKKYDLIIPSVDKKEDIPLLVWIHGGAWSGGEKRIHHEFERFVYRGYAILSIEYRLSHEAPFPAQIIDCKKAIRWARANADKYGYNADYILVGGNSAGGHLASLLGVTNGIKEFDCEGGYYEYSSDVQAVADLFGPVDIEQALYTNDRPSVLKLLKNDTVPIEEMAKKASCLTYVNEKVPPFLIVQGMKDPSTPYEMSRNFYRILKEVGCDVTYHEEPDGMHGFDTPEYYNALTDFVESHCRK